MVVVVVVVLCSSDDADDSTDDDDVEEVRTVWWVRTVEAVNGILVEYTAVSIETLTAGDVTSNRVKHHCTHVYNIAGPRACVTKDVNLSRKFITRQKLMNFGTVVDDHNRRKISKSCNWEILVSHLNIFF